MFPYLFPLASPSLPPSPSHPAVPLDSPLSCCSSGLDLAVHLFVSLGLSSGTCFMHLCLRQWGTQCFIHRKCSKNVCCIEKIFYGVAEIHKPSDISLWCHSVVSYSEGPAVPQPSLSQVQPAPGVPGGTRRQPAGRVVGLYCALGWEAGAEAAYPAGAGSRENTALVLLRPVSLQRRG